MPSIASWELPATAGWPDQYASDGESHHGARNGFFSLERIDNASSRSSHDSLRRCMRAASSDSLGQIRASQNCAIGKIDIANAIHAAARELIEVSKVGSEIARINKKK